MDLDFGHGFVPRIGTDNYKAIDRCLGPGRHTIRPRRADGRAQAR
jgi:hypothetical protein